MSGEKEKIDRKIRWTRAFSVVIIVVMVLSVCGGIVAVENGSLTMNAKGTQNVTGIGTDAQGRFIGNPPFEIKVPRDKERLKVPEKEIVGISRSEDKDMLFPAIAQNKTPGLRIFSFTRNAIRNQAQRNVTGSMLIDNESRNVNISEEPKNYCIPSLGESVDMALPFEMGRIDRIEENIEEAEKAVEQSSLRDRETVQENKTASLEEPFSNLTITILNETTASVEWLTHAPGEYASYIPFYKGQMENNIEDVEKGIEDLFLQDVEDIRITWGDETLLVTFNLKGDYANGFLTGKYHYTYELSQYAPAMVSVFIFRRCT
jgi:hypothetical protein